jgi:uncharacterized protein GlcG (DUF336 family)
MNVTSAQTQRLVAAAMTKAQEMRLAVSVAVLDSAGFLMGFARADGASPHTVGVAIGKAYGVIFMGRTSAEIRDLAESRAQFFGAIKDLGAHTLIPSPGGVAILGGAIGVSGAPSPDQDVEIAEVAIAAAVSEEE